MDKIFSRPIIYLNIFDFKIVEIVYFSIHYLVDYTTAGAGVCSV